MSSVVTFCRTIDGGEAAPTGLPKRAGDEDFCDAEVVCKCGGGPVVCCRGEHDGSHAAYGVLHLLCVWDEAPGVES